MRTGDSGFNSANRPQFKLPKVRKLKKGRIKLISNWWLPSLTSAARSMSSESLPGSALSLESTSPFSHHLVSDAISFGRLWKAFFEINAVQLIFTGLSLTTQIRPLPFE